MNLVLDIGNSTVKMAVFKGDYLVESFNSTADQFEHSVDRILEKHQSINRALIAAVSDFNLGIIEKLSAQCVVQKLDHTFNFPFKNLYKTPKSLGLDRVALASGAVKQYPKTNVLIIDAGTCMTFDFVDVKSQYWGGAISPGLRMRYKAISSQTSRLPHLSPEVPRSVMGETTKDSIHSGIVHGMLQEIEGTVGVYRNKFPELTVVMTGGDRDFLCKQLKISIFAVSNLLLEGLNHILELNSEK